MGLAEAMRDALGATTDGRGVVDKLDIATVRAPHLLLRIFLPLRHCLPHIPRPTAPSSFLPLLNSSHQCTARPLSPPFTPTSAPASPTRTSSPQLNTFLSHASVCPTDSCPFGGAALLSHLRTCVSYTNFCCPSDSHPFGTVLHIPLISHSPLLANAAPGPLEPFSYPLPSCYLVPLRTCYS
ncbi:unnamed protein product [Closterium sp. NIES-64]|nr:unnamed protein product [Closterium sp. NIES-64]